MSGIYGFSYSKLEINHQTHEDTIGALAYWNRIYGRSCHDFRDFGNSGIGCYIEHFSDKFPYGGPILDFDGSPAVIDALIFNRDELALELALEPDCTLPDEDLLLLWIRNMGFDALSKVNGDFAGAIYDPEKEEWTLFRDHMGVRPLYYYMDENCFAFSTDLRALAAMPLADTRIDKMQFFINVTGTNPLSIQRTDFELIRCVLPAAVTSIKKTGNSFTMTEHVYWAPCRKSIRFHSDEEYQQELRRLITDSVNRRCDAISGLLGAELSGGLDSSVIDSLINRHGREARFYSWSRDPDFLPIVAAEDERLTILEICKREKIACHFMRKEDTVSLQDRGEHVIPPYVDTFMLGYGSAWLNSQGAKVVFTGHGGDEGVSHRGRRFELYYCREYSTYYRYYRQDFTGKFLGSLRAVRTGWLNAQSDLRTIKNGPSTVPRHLDVLNNDFSKEMQARFEPQVFTFNFAPHIFVMQGGTRPRMDNVAYQGAFNGVRYLFPYVDYRVMDYALSIPRSQYVGYKVSRRIFREAFRDLLPQTLYLRDYKDQVSARQLPRQAPDAKAHEQHVHNLLTQLDRELWMDYFDFEKLETKLIDYQGNSGGIGSVDALHTYLHRCIMIQNVQQNAKRWREFDEQDKTV